MAKKMIDETHRLAIVSLNNQLRDHEQEMDELAHRVEAARWYLAAASGQVIRRDGKDVTDTDVRIMELKYAVEHHRNMQAKVDVMRRTLYKLLADVDEHIVDDPNDKED